MQELLLRIGRRGTIESRPCRQAVLRGRTLPSTGTEYTITERRTERLSLERKENLGTDHYRGRVYCATVPNGLLVTRRNKSTLISGNSCWDYSGTGTVEIAYNVAALGGGLVLSRAVIELSLCMIVRDNARTLEAALRSIKPWVDELVVVDTGSQVETPQIAARLGAGLGRFPWCDDFAAARNESLRLARGRWLFWMDSDDTIDEANGRQLRELVRRPVADSLLGYIMKVRCPGSAQDGDEDFTEVDQVKLFRNLPYLRFEGRIHEQIIPAINRAAGDLFVVHSGSEQSPEGQARKLERDLRILHKEIAERPQHPFTLFNLGMTYRDAREYEKAEGYLRRSIYHSNPRESHLRKAYAYLVDCCQALGRSGAAWQACEEGLRLFPEDVELRFLQGGLLHQAGRSQETAAAYLGLFEAPSGRHFSSRQRGLTGFLARQNLAVVYSDLGDLARAEEQWRLVVREMPRYRPGWRGLGDVLVRQGKHQEAQAQAQRLLADEPLRPEGLVLQSRLAAARGDLAQARQYLQQATQEAPNDPEAWQALCQFLIEHAEPAETEPVVKELIRCDPRDAAAYHNLGTTYSRLGRYPEAIAAYRESIRHRPNAPGTYVQLAQALQACGLVADAVSTWRDVLRLDPGNPAATEALRAANHPG